MTQKEMEYTNFGNFSWFYLLKCAQMDNRVSHHFFNILKS